MKPFKSNYKFKTVDDLVAEKNKLHSAASEKMKRREIVARFVNGLSMLTQDTLEADGGEEIVNYLTQYRHLSNRQARLVRTVTAINDLVVVKVHTGDDAVADQDYLDGERISEAINKEMVYRGRAFINMIKGIAGEIQISGGVPLVNSNRKGWGPRRAVNMLFPKDTALDADEMTYCFDFEEFDLGQLEEMSGGGEFISKEAIQKLKEKAAAVPDGTSRQRFSNAKDKTGSVRESVREDSIKVGLWWFYEVWKEKGKEPWVNATLFSDILDLEKKSGAVQVAFVEKKFENPSDFLMWAAMDLEIGSDTTVDTLRGAAEIIFPSAQKIEELLGMIIEGDMMRAKPRYVVGDASTDDLLNWKPDLDSVVPKGVLPFDMKGSSAPLMTPFSLLNQNTAGMTSGDPNQGRGDVLRQQEVGRQRTSMDSQAAEMAMWYDLLDDIVENMVWKAMTEDVSAGCPGYKSIKRVRDCLEKYKIDWKKLGKRENGGFKYLSVRVNRALGDGAYADDQTSIDFLLQLRPAIDPALRPRIMRRAIAIKTGDPELANELVKIPVPVLSSQTLVAENEGDTIERRASIGYVAPTNVDDIHQYHIPVHILDMTALVATHQLRPWTQLQMMQFAGYQRHVQTHLEILLNDAVTQPEALQYLPQMNSLVTAARAIAAEMENAEAESEISQLDQQKLQLSWAQEQRKQVELGVKVENAQSLERQRNAREQASRQNDFIQNIAMAANARRADKALAAKTYNEAERNRIAEKSVDKKPVSSGK